MMAFLTSVVLASATAVPPDPDATTAPPAAVEPAAPGDQEPAVPLSAYDRMRRSGSPETAVPAEEEPSWGTQLVRTFIALAVVVGLIYLFFKVGLVRLMGIAAVRGGKTIRVSERLQLDARHALFVVEIDGGDRMLLATGEQGVQVLERLHRRRGDFQSTLEAATPGTLSPGGSGDRDTND